MQRHEISGLDALSTTTPELTASGGYIYNARMRIDPKKLPMTAEYLQNLPAGLSSHPDARLNAEVLDPMRRRFPELGSNPALPAAAAEAFKTRGSGVWISEVAGNALYLACRELSFPSDEAFLRWSYDATTELFQKPIYRVAMFVLSPTLVVLGAQRRWSSFHTGSSLSATSATRQGSRTATNAVLAYPHGLFPRLMIEFNARAFKAAVDAASGKGSKASVEAYAATRAEILVSWDA